MEMQATQALQSVEQQLQQLAIHRQSLHSRLMEIESALKAVESTQVVYKTVGSVMVKSTTETISKELTEEKEKVSIRLKTVEKQEEKLKEKKTNLQNEVMKGLSGDADE